MRAGESSQYKHLFIKVPMGDLNQISLKPSQKEELKDTNANEEKKQANVLLWMWASHTVHSTTFLSEVNVGEDLTEEQKQDFLNCNLCCDADRPSLARLTPDYLTECVAEVIGNMTFMNAWHGQFSICANGARTGYT